MSRLRRAAMIAFCLHLLAGLSMAFILRRGLETNPDLQDRLAFLATHRVLWTFGWLTWTAAALAILYFYMVFSEVHTPSMRFALALTVAAVACDLAAQAIEIGVRPSVGNVSMFLMFHRVAVMLSGYVANGLYSASALILAWSARRAYPVWVSFAGLAAGMFGLALSLAALLDSVSGMFWTNVLLVPALLAWLGGVAASPLPPGRGPSSTCGEG